MPEIKLKHVVSCSSSDATHKADNLLKSDTFHKWKSRVVGEKQVSVILQFEKEEQIYSIDVGNECSAFVEVLVGHSTSVSEQEYEVILATSSFMSPSESKSEKNRNRLRMFGPDKLVKAVVEKKWDRAKIVCTQPYNKNMAYGLSFIRFNSPPDKDDPSPSDSSPKVTKLGQFKLKEEDESAASMRPGSLFFSRPAKPQDTPPKVTQAAQSYASVALQGSSSTSTESGSTSDKPPAKTTPSSNTPKDPSSSKRKFEFNKEPAGQPPAKKADVKESLSRPKESTSQPAPKKIKVESSTPPSTKKPSPSEKPSHKKSPSASPSVEFGQILQGTVFVLSGFQNPFRADLRDKALEMGAKYRPDWSPDCTHLICAFANTPKYMQVKAAGGIIVRKEWVMDCYRKQQRLPHKKYLMTTSDSSSEEDDDSESEEESTPRHKAAAHRPNTNSGGTNHKNPASSPFAAKPSKAPVKEEDGDEKPKPANTREDDYGGSTDEECKGEGRKQGGESGSDTEDDLVGPNVERPVKKEPAPLEDPYGGSTDENTDAEEEAQLDLPIPDLPDLFTSKHFFLYGNFPPAERRTLQRYITAFNGELEEYMSEKVQFVITSQEWDDSFEDALNDYSNLSFVRPRWIYNCNERQKCIPHQPYVVVPLE